MIVIPPPADSKKFDKPLVGANTEAVPGPVKGMLSSSTFLNPFADQVLNPPTPVRIEDGVDKEGKKKYYTVNCRETPGTIAIPLNDEKNHLYKELMARAHKQFPNVAEANLKATIHAMDLNHDGILTDTEMYTQNQVVAMKNEKTELERLKASKVQADQEAYAVYRKKAEFVMKKTVGQPEVHDQLMAIAHPSSGVISKEQFIGVLRSYQSSVYNAVNETPITPEFIDAYATEMYEKAAARTGDKNVLTVQDVELIYQRWLQLTD